MLENLEICQTNKLRISKKIYVQSGAGIVADSNPKNEFNETVNKAKALLKAIN